LNSDFSWKSHVEAITSKAMQRIYFLKQLRRADVPQSNLLHFYTGIIRPVLEYAAPVWNHLLSKSQIYQIEAIQRRALRIIYSTPTLMICLILMHYTVPAFLALSTVENSPLASFFYINPTIIILSSYPLPTPRDPIITTRLRSANKFPRLPSRTRKYHTFISYTLAHYQTSSILSPITIQFVFDVFVLYVLRNFYCTALLCYLVLWPQSSINYYYYYNKTPE